MGTHPIFESDFDCLTEIVKCWVRFFLSRIWSQLPFWLTWETQFLHLGNFGFQKHVQKMPILTLASDQWYLRASNYSQRKSSLLRKSLVRINRKKKNLFIKK